MLTKNTQNRTEKFLLIATILVVTIKILEVLTPMAHGDALYYHLPIARMWVERGFIEMHRSLCGSLQGGLFDYLYLITVGIFGTNVFGQISSQLFYFLSSIGVAGFLTIKEINPKPIAKYFSVLFFITFSVDSDFFIFAKNDGVLASIGFLATLEFVNNSISSRLNLKNDLLLKSILLGILPLIKINGIIISLILGIYYLISKKCLNSTLKIAIISIFISLPIFFRNYYFLETPFFPALVSKFPGNLNSGMIAFYNSALEAKINLPSLYFHLKAFFVFKIIALILLISHFKLILKTKLLHFFIISLSIFCIYLFINGGVPAARFYFVCFFINSYIVLKILSNIELTSKKTLLILIVMLADSKIDKSLGRIKKSFIAAKSSSSEKEFINKTVSLTNIWNFIPENSKIVTDDFSQIFYSPKGTYLYQYQCNQEAYFLYNCQSESEVKELHKYDFVILSDLKNTNNKCTDFTKANFNHIYQDGQYHLYKNPKSLLNIP